MKFRIYQDLALGWRWRLRASNGRVMADSAESYTERNDCREALDTILRNLHEGRFDIDLDGP